MAIGITDRTLVESIGVEVDVAQKVRIRSFVFDDDGSFTIDFEYRAQATNALLGTQEFRFGPEPTPADPPADILDPETDEVLIAKGERSPALPSRANLEGLDVGGTAFGTIMRQLQGAGYIIARRLNAKWTNAPEV